MDIEKIIKLQMAIVETFQQEINGNVESVLKWAEKDMPTTTASSIKQLITNLRAQGDRLHRVAAELETVKERIR